MDNNVNIDKLRSSSENLNSLSNKLDSFDLQKEFSEIEKAIKKINFEHGNCLENYKNDLSLLEEKYEEVKTNIKKITNSLVTTVEQFSVEDKKSSNQFDLKNLSTNLTQIPKVEPEQEVVKAEQTTTINTIPIGLGIAATGISASVGAIVADALKDKKKKNIIEEYNPSEGSKDEPIREQSTKEENKLLDNAFDDYSPYHASRNSNSIDKFYGTNITEYYEDEEENDNNFE